LILGDLPTSIFWAAGSCPAGNLIEGLLPFGRQLVYDSLEWEAAEPAIEAVTQLTDSAHQRLDLGDLSWRRMKPLRRALVQAIDPALVPDLGTLRGITIDHSPERNGMIARLLLGWIGARLGWRPVSRNGSEWRLRADGREVRAAISSGSTDAQLRVRLETDRVPNGAAVELTATDAEILVSYGMSAAPFAMVAPKRSRADLIAAELRTLRLDNLLYEALAFLRSAQAVD
jgi:glucose-6-phosphate dehydrogenase assembly protein OpcA